MALCKICGVPVEAGPAMHGGCLEELVEQVAEQFCDDYCRWTLTNVELLEEHCLNCPMDRLQRLVKP